MGDHIQDDVSSRVLKAPLAVTSRRHLRCRFLVKCWIYRVPVGSVLTNSSELWPMWTDTQNILVHGFRSLLCNDEVT